MNAEPQISASTPPTIAWLINGDEGYGVGRAVRALATGIQRRGWKPIIISLGDGVLADSCESAGMTVHRLNVGKSPDLVGSRFLIPQRLARLWQYNRRALRPVIAALDRHHADALHVLLPHLVALAGQSAALAGSGIQCFWEMPNEVGGRYLGLNRFLYQRTCRRFHIQPLANSAYTATTLGDRCVEPIICHLSADESVFNPEIVQPISRSALSIPDNAIVLGICARLTASKGQDRVLRAMLEIGDSPASLHLLLLGGPVDDDFTNHLRRLAAAVHAENRLHFTGVVPDPERYYPVMDVVINSRVDPEPFGLSVVEAMMMGRPTLVHALGGPTETVLDGVTGWHISEPSQAAVLVGLRRALADRPRWPQMGHAARQRALDHFSSYVQVKRYMEIVSAAMNHPVRR